MDEGQLVTPTLRLVRALGRGGMGSVWVADHLALHTQVAVKFMDARFATNADYVRRFQTEAIAAASIKSPHVAQVFDHGVTHDYQPYIVMELLEGEDLRTRLKRDGPMSPQELAPILTQTCKALGRAHALGIVHRDVKPDNVFLVNMGDETFVKVLDFGIAKLGGDDTGDGFTVTGNTLGTPFYMSPEQLLSSKAVDFRSDLWSIGVVVYQALTGARPFRGETIGAVSVAVHGGAFAAPSRARTGLSPAIDAWVTKALQREPENRFGSAREMAAAFEAAMLSPNDTELDIGAMAELIEDDDVSDSARTIALSAPSEGPVSTKKEAGRDGGHPHAPGAPESKRPAPVLESKRVIVPVVAAASPRKDPATTHSRFAVTQLSRRRTPTAPTGPTLAGTSQTAPAQGAVPATAERGRLPAAFKVSVAVAVLLMSAIAVQVTRSSSAPIVGRPASRPLATPVRLIAPAAEAPAPAPVTTSAPAATAATAAASPAPETTSAPTALTPGIDPNDLPAAPTSAPAPTVHEGTLHEGAPVHKPSPAPRATAIPTAAPVAKPPVEAPKDTIGF